MQARNIQVIPCVPQLSRPGKRALLDQVSQVPCRGRARSLADGDVVFGAQAALETVSYSRPPP